jgi:hypothetical protein
VYDSAWGYQRPSWITWILTAELSPVQRQEEIEPARAFADVAGSQIEQAPSSDSDFK